MTSATPRSDVRSDRGAVLVIVAAGMLGVILVAGLVIDTANWFEHHRHLQLQADAGALAGAATFNACASATDAQKADPTSTANTSIVSNARRYAGDPNATAPYNKQVSADPNITVWINSTNYGSGGLDNSQTDPSPGGPPCKAGYVDVKATDSKLPWFMFPGLVPAINTHARVSIFQVNQLTGSLPLAVEDVNPYAAGAIFVNEDSSNAVLAATPLTAGSAQTLNGVGVISWTGGPVTVPISTKDTGVVIALCTNKKLCGTPGNNAWLSGSVSAVCGQLFVTCQVGNGTGLEFIRGYSTSGTGSATAPILRSVTLTSGTCTDDSAPYFLLNGGCKIGVRAQLDFGTTTDPSKSVLNGGLGATVKVAGCTLSYTGSSGTTSSWSVSNCPTVASGAGQDPLSLTWSTTLGGSRTISQVARPFANDGATDTQSYPVAYAELSQGATCSSGGANSVPFGNYSICVGVGLVGNLKNAADINDPTKVLKFFGGSRTGAVDCDPNAPGAGATKLKNEIINGCSVAVQVNTGEACPNTTTPVDCLPLFNGGKVGPTRQGMNDRFAPAGVCSPNNWLASNIPPGGVLPNIPNGDRRLVPLIITLYGSISGSGSGEVPVTDLGDFYVTGWDGAPPSCSGINEPTPAGAGVGNIWGHFVKYVGSFPTSTGKAGCDFSAFAPCITVMTR